MGRQGAGTPSGPLAVFCARLKRLQEASGLTQTAVAGHAGMGKSQMSAILNGSIKQLPDWEVVRLVVRACLDHGARTRRVLPSDLLDERDWQRRYADLEQDIEVAERPRRVPDVDAKPISRWDPFMLGVHHPIAAVWDSPGWRLELGSPRQLPRLPSYVLREHDLQLRKLLDPGHPGASMAVLVGESCTGKTRAAYEAINSCLPGWHVVRPETSGELVHLLDGHLLSSQSVLWLNETQDYLEGEKGEEAAAALRRLLAGSIRIRVVGTMWDVDWRYLTERPAPGSPGHPQVRELLGQSVARVTVPTSFAGRALTDLLEAARNDPRLAEAARAASGAGQIAQLIAGGPWLLDFYQHEADPYTKAVIDAAVDASRVGHHSPLPASMLEEAAAGYLDDHQRAITTGWFNDAITRATERIKGAVAPLSPIRTRRGTGKPDGYLLADYLLQHAHTNRSFSLQPVDLWDALASHVDDVSDHVRIAQAALKCYYKRHAALHFRSAVRGSAGVDDTMRAARAVQDPHGFMHGHLVIPLSGVPEECNLSLIASERALAQVGAPQRDLWTTASRALAGLLSQSGQFDDAAELHRRVFERADKSSYDYTDCMRELATALEKAGRFNEAEGIWRRQITADEAEKYDHPMRMLASLLVRSGRITDAIDVSQRLADRGNSYAMEAVAEQLERAGKLDEAAAVWRRLAARDDPYATRVLAELLERAGHIEDALAVWQPAAQGGEACAMGAMAGLLERAGRVDEAVAVWQPSAEDGDIYAIRDLAALLERAGRIDRAIALCQPAAEREDVAAMELLAGLLERAGRTDEAIATWESLVMLGEPDYAKRELSALLERAGRTEDAEAVWKHAHHHGDPLALKGLAALLERAGRVDEAVAVWQPSAEDGDIYAIRDLAALLERAGRIDRAIALCQPAAEREDVAAMELLAGLLERAGRTDEAIVTWESLVMLGEPDYAKRELSALLERAGRISEAAAIWRIAAEEGNTAAMRTLAKVLSNVGLISSAERWLRIAVQHGDAESVTDLLELLRTASRHDEAEQILKFGLEPGGQTSHPWT